MDKTRGQVAYEAYWDDSGGRSRRTGERLPLWQDVDPGIQAGWEAAGLAVEQRFAEQFRTVFEALWNAAKPVVYSAAAAVSKTAGENGWR